MKLKNQSGEVAIESMMVMIPTLFVMVFLIALGFNYYQQWNVRTVANDVAVKIGQTYSLLECDVNSGNPSDNDLFEKPLYRYIFSSGKYEIKNSIRANELGVVILEKTSFGYVNSSDINITADTKYDSLARRHICVTVETTQKIPFSEGFELFGLDGERTYRSTASSECIDMLDYTSTINFVKNAKSFIKIPVVDDAIKMIDSWLKVFKTIHEGEK